MPFNPFTALTSKIFGGVAIALALLCALLWWRADSAAEEALDWALVVNGQLETKLEVSNASIAELEKSIEGQNDAIVLMQREADERAEAGRKALEQAKREGREAKALAERLRNAPKVKGEQAQTSDMVMQNRDKL